jgi:GNAT superfamily N-acetyltransferase
VTDLTVSQIEAAALTTWPALQTAYDGLWLWRGSRGFTKRANSIHCLDPSDGTDADRRLAYMAELSILHGLPPIFRVTPQTAPEAIAAIDRQGWMRLDESMVLARPMPERDFEVTAKAVFVEAHAPEWYGVSARFGGYDEDTTDALATMMALMACESCGVIITEDDDTPVATALVAISSGIAMFFNVIVDEAKRGQGYGRAAMAAGLNAARAAGATHAALQTLANDPIPQNLYSSLGFAEAYHYHYRVPAELIR